MVWSREVQEEVQGSSCKVQSGWMSQLQASRKRIALKLRKTVKKLDFFGNYWLNRHLTLHEQAEPR